jgi:hypothetical protein
MCTHAGLVIDEKQRVLDENDDPKTQAVSPETF